MRTITKIFLFFLATLSLLGGIYAVAAWQSPTAGPPANNTDAPLHIGSDFQEKTGGLKLLYLILKPGEKPADTEGAMFYDTANKIFQCFQNDKWYNCLGYILPKIKADNSGFETDILQIINPLRTDKMARLANVLGPVENNDAANKEFVVNYVDDKVGTGSGSLSDIKQSWQMYNIYITPDTHDGNFGGWPGVDKFCQDQMNNKQCLGFSSDMLSASYVGGSPLNFGTWDNNIEYRAFYGHRFIEKDFIHQNLTDAETISQYYNGLTRAWPAGNYNLSCNGFLSVSGNATLFMSNYENISQPCSNKNHFLCACPGSTLKRWKIVPTTATHNGNFAGIVGADKFCADQLGQNCRMFSNDILHSAYYNGPRLNYAEWDKSSVSSGWFGNYYILEEDGKTSSNNKKGATVLYRGGCWGWTTTMGQGILFEKNGAITSANCNLEKPVICACPEN